MAKKLANHTIGVDIGGTKILAVLLDDQFRVKSEIKLKTKPEHGDAYFLEALEDGIETLLQDTGLKREHIRAIGAGCAGFIHPTTGVVSRSANLPFLKNYPLAQKLSKIMRKPAFVGNDVHTGLYGEHQFGAAKDRQNVVGIFIGTGIGGSLILNGQTYTGASGMAGEVGHVLFDPNGPFCGCGKRGCMEAFAGRLAISSEAAAAAARQRAPHLAAQAGTDLRQIKSGMLAKAAGQDKIIAEIIRAKARIVGGLMATLVNILNPEMIVLGGGVVQAMPRLIVPEAIKAMHEQAIPDAARRVKVVAAKLGDYAVAMGAAKRAWDKWS